MKMKRAVFGLLLLVPLALQAQTQATSPTSDERQVRDSVIMQSTLYFDSNVCENIPSSQYYKMAVFLKSVKQNLNTKVRIVGWTDNVGTSDFNKQFALKRAQSMKGYLIRQGVASERISILGEGIDTHAASGNKARRVDMTQIVELVLGV